ncbi:glycosyltransferase [Haliea sp. E1-2-M8]|uniref:glycosyltransferase n=1 Tax=Haliea sp. E1-2-M8 TaxID=3064706 RepID=UPI00271565BB|nr:glycosyltransferase [Haliea sp. E1-2-M8]MDO8863828.1 glycosyltransferase [Haliea sp. E1-2-M8]
MAKKIAVFPEPGAIGPLMNLIGISQGLRNRGYDIYFILEPGLRGTAEQYGFKENYISCMPPMSEAEQAKYWDDFMVDYMPTFRYSPLGQVGTYVKACWEAITDTSRWSVKNGLDKVIADINPDLIINDNVAVYPATQKAGCPWVRMISCSENEIIDPDIPPHLSGCAEKDKKCFEQYNWEFEKQIKPLHDEFMDFLEECGCQRLPFPEFVSPSPYLNLLLYPKPLRFNRRNPLDPSRFVYLDGCVRDEPQNYTLPSFESNNDSPLIYLSYGTLGGADVELIKRMINILGDQPYRVLVNVGEYMDQYKEGLPDNVHISAWYPQVAVLPHVDIFIQHGGNNSFNESLYHGIPPLIMPFVWDGHDNAQRVNDTRHGIGMHRYEWSDNEFLDNIRTLLSDEEIRSNVRATSEYMRSQDGKEKAAEAIDQFLQSSTG